MTLSMLLIVRYIFRSIFSIYRTTPMRLAVISEKAVLYSDKFLKEFLVEPELFV